MHTRVLVLCGSASDIEVLRPALEVLEQFGVTATLHVSSAHRALDRTVQLVRDAERDGCQVVIAAAGLAAHLPGVVAAATTLPVIGIPIASGPLQGQDALHAIVQMPPGIPVATVAINGAKNAALLAIQMLALGDERLAHELDEYRATLTDSVLAADARHSTTITTATTPPASLEGATHANARS